MTSFSDPYADWLATTPDPFSFGGSSGGTSQQPIPGPYGDIFADLLEEEPEIPFQGALSRAKLTPNQFQTFRNQRENIFKQFQAQLDAQLRQGILPTARFADFVGDFNFEREFERFAPSQRVGGGTRSFAAPIRYDRNR